MVDNTKFLANNIVLNDINDCVNLVATRGAGDDVLVGYVGFENSVKNVMRPMFKAFIGEPYINQIERYKNIDFSDGIFEYLLLGKEPRVLLKADYPDLALRYGITDESFNTPTIYDFMRFMDRGGSFNFNEKIEGKVKEHNLSIDLIPSKAVNATLTQQATVSSGSGGIVGPYASGNSAGNRNYPFTITIPSHQPIGKGGNLGAVENTPNHQYAQLYIRAKILF